jgi:DNA-binding MarR family transcriptional regulator
MKNWANYSFIIRSVHRKRIFESLDKPKTPTQLANDLSIDLGYISNLIISLLERELIECLNPKEKRHRLYIRSKKGNDLLKEMNNLKV